VSIRHAALSIGAVLVLGLGVYLFVEVRTQPVTAATPGPTHDAAPAPAAPAEAAPPAAAPPVTRALAAGSAPPAPIAPAAVGSSAPPPAPALAAGDSAAAPADLDAAMAEANRSYDRGDLDEAKTLALRLLARQPGNVRMLRIVVSASCIDGDATTAVASFGKLPAQDQAQMRVRCARYGVAFPDRP
jgi:hypothetical protein